MSTVLIVDDSATMRKIISMHLEASGLAIDTVLQADNGEAAMELLASNQVDLVLSDMNMPGMGGLGLLDALRTAGNAVPVVVISSEGAEALMATARAAGADGYLAKPFDPVRLDKILGPLLEASCHR